MSAGPDTTLLRARTEGGGRVSNVELFFDLVFAFAVTQLSHRLLGRLDAANAGETLLLFLAVWWVWIYTSWVTNWLDPDHRAVRLLLFALMGAGLVLSASIPAAFGERRLAFALAVVAMQLGRALFMTAVLRGVSATNHRNFVRISIWSACSAVFWIAGGVAARAWAAPLFGIALAIEFVAPSLGFAVPRLGRSATTDWDVDGGHLAERCSAFVLIALGESITVTGAEFFEDVWNGVNFAAFAASLLGSIALWWIYFDRAAEIGRARIASAPDPGRLARIAYTYLHALLIAGIVVTAVGDALAIHAPTRTARAVDAAVVAAGPILFLLGMAGFGRVVGGMRTVGMLVACALLGLASIVLAGHRLIALDAASSLILLAVACA